MRVLLSASIAPGGPRWKGKARRGLALDLPLFEE
jgi:hypothetical protein